MISFEINGVPCLFIKAFTSEDVETILNFVRAASANKHTADNSVLFIDTPITASTVEAVLKLQKEGYRVCFRDHHGIDGESVNDRDRKVEQATAKLRQALGADCNVTVRRLHPACSTLVDVGEFAGAAAIVADPDADGLTAAMKAAGVSYPELDVDAALLDGEPHLQVTGSPISRLLAKGMATLPSFDADYPKRRLEAQADLFAHWVKAVTGNKASLERLQPVLSAYDEAVQVAQALARDAEPVVPGVVLVNCAGKPVFDVGTLTTLLEQTPDCRITVVRKDLGPIAQLHGMQYSLSVAKQYQKTMNLQKLLPSDVRSDPQFGIISNVSFVLHVSEDVWKELIVPKLKQLSESSWAGLA